MDSQIYYLLASAEKEKDVDHLKRAFQILDPEVSTGKDTASKDVENFSQSLYVECAEKAINFNERAIAERCIKIYFNLPQIANQFLPRAYLCQFQLLAPQNSNELENLNKSIPFLFEAIEFGRLNKRYNFLVYNASLIFWKYARAFVKTNFKKYLCTALNRITQALNELDDADYEWRAFLEHLLVEAYLENKQEQEAKALAVELTKFIRKKVPQNFDEYFQFLIRENLLSDEELKSTASSKWNLDAIYRLEKLKKSKTDAELKEDKMEQISNELNSIYELILKGKSLNETKTNKSNEFMKSMSNLKKEDLFTQSKKQRLLLDTAQMCLLYEDVNICSQIVGYLKETEITNDEFIIEIEFIEAEQAVKELKHKQEKYTKNSVKIRIDSLVKCHEALKNAKRLQNPNLVQLGCLCIWRLSLPLLQAGLRSNVRKPLEFIAECLEEIDSMEWLLRCRIHFELAKCEEEIEQLQVAEQHLIKAIRLDDERMYAESLEHNLKRLRLRGELYKTPEKLEDQAAMIIEQCVVGLKGKEKRLKPAIGELLKTLSQSSNLKSNEINTHSLLMRAADLLAPNEFTHVLESESHKNFLRANEDKVSQLYKKYLNYENCINKCNDHLANRISDLERNYKRKNESNPNMTELERMVSTDYKERLKIWFDLCRIARIQKIWDICRVSAKFCLLYDNEPYVSRFLKQSASNSKEQQFKSLFDRELMRNLAEIHYILGEAMIQFIRNEGIELFESPKSPELDEANNQKQSESLAKRDFQTDKEWIGYCDWLAKLCKEAVNHFLRGIQIGIQLNESWLVCQGCAYLWNYLNHKFEQKKHKQVIHILLEMYESLKKVGHNHEAELLVAVCVGLAQAYILPWLPEEQVKTLQIPSLPSDDPKTAGARKPVNTGGASKPLSFPSEANADLKKALEACDYAMNITNGENMADLVSLRDRFPLIKTWVLCKQLNQSSIKNLGVPKIEQDKEERVQDKFTKCMVGLEILNRNGKLSSGNYEIKEAPSIKDLILLVDVANVWSDKLVELEIWSNLTSLAGRQGQTDNARYAHSKALELLSYFEKKKNDRFVYLSSQFYFSQACIALGEHLAQLLNSPITSSSQQTSKNRDKDKDDKGSRISMTSVSSKDVRTALRRDALNAFSDGAFYASKAENYDLCIHAARHFWNTALAYLKNVQERATLYDNIGEILASLQVAYKFKPESAQSESKSEQQTGPSQQQDQAKQEEKPKETDVQKSKKRSDTAEGKKKSEASKQESLSKVEPKTDTVAQSASLAVDAVDNSGTGTNEDAFDDLTLRTVLYACSFQILIDKKEFEEALEQMDTALNDLPRTKHRLLVYRFKVIIKSKLGMDVQMDLQKFREESEKNLAQMYRKVALSSAKHSDTINCYQKAIEALNSDESIWLKFEYIIELAQWLYSHEYELNQSVDMCEWAIDLIMFNVKVEKRIQSASSTMPSSRLSKTQVAKKGKQATTTNIMPTIEDDVEVSTVHKQMESKASAEVERIAGEQANRKDLFDVTMSSNRQEINWDDFQDIKQLDCFIRAHTILAQMCGRSSADYLNYLLKAYYSVIRIFYQSIENAMSSIKDIAKLNAATTGGTATAAPGGANDAKKDGKNKAQQQQQAKASDTKGAGGQKKLKLELGASGYMPQTLEQWSQFELSEEIASAWSHDLMRKTGINEHTVSEPYLLFYYLDLLAKMLKDLGHTQLLFPIYNFQLVLINNVMRFESALPNVNNNTMNAYVRLKLINTCVDLNLIQSVYFQQQALANSVLNNGKPQDVLANPTQTAYTIADLQQNPSILLKLIQIDSNEVCEVREQINIHKQRLARLEDEESSLKDKSATSFGSTSLRRTLSKKKSTSVRINDQKSSSNKLSLNELNLPGEKKVVSSKLFDTLYKDVWIEMAEQLIENGFFQTARDYLFESLSACNVFDDKTSQAKVNYLLAKISLFDCNFVEARNYASQAQKTAIDEMFWYKCIRLLVDSYKLDVSEKDTIEKCLKILNKSIDLVNKEKAKRANKLNTLNYIEAMFIYEMAELTSDGNLSGKMGNQDMLRKRANRYFQKRNSMHPTVFKALSDSCDMYQKSTEIFITNGYKREAVQVLKSHARLLTQFANDCHIAEAKHDYLLQTLIVLNDALSIQNELLTEVTYLQVNTADLQTVSLAVQRELVDVKCELAQLCTDILQVHLDEVKKQNETNLKKDQVVKAVETFLQTSANQNEIERQWKRMIYELPDLLSSTLVSCHSLAGKIKHLKAPVFYLFGRSFRLVSDLKFQLRKASLSIDAESEQLNMHMTISKWSHVLIDIIKAQQSQSMSDLDPKSVKVKPSKSTAISVRTVDSTSEKPNSHLNDLQHTESQVFLKDDQSVEALTDRVNNDSHLGNILDQENLKNLLLSVNKSESLSMECLLQALNMGFSLSDLKLIRNATLELIELIGRLDLNLCSQLIALYQSCANGLEIENLIKKSSVDPKNSLLVSYFHQMSFYSAKNVAQNALNSPIIKQLMDGIKSKFNAFKYLNVQMNHFNMSKDLPSNYNLLIIQHNSSKTELYAAVLDRSKGSANAPGAKKTQTSASNTTKAQVIKLKTDPFELTHLKHQWKQWKQDLQAFNLKIEFQLNNDLIRKSENNLETRRSDFSRSNDYLNDSLKHYLSTSNAKFEECLDQYAELESTFGILLQKTENYMKGVTEFYQNYFNSIQNERLQQQQQQQQSGKQTSTPANQKPNERCVILADLELFEFPLECLKVFHDNQMISSISRDFSLQFFATRFMMQKDTDLSSKADDKKDKGGKAGPAAGGDQKGKNQFVPSNTDPLPETASIVDANQVKYLIDAFNEASPGLPADILPITQFKSLVQQYSSFTSKWQGITGADHISSLGERENLLNDSSCFIFNGTERFLSYFNSTKISSFNLNDCKLILSNDLAQTNKSFSRIGKTDVVKNIKELECENSLEASVLLSLTGAKCILMNQWSGTLVENGLKFQALFKEFFENRQSCGEIVRNRVSPHIKLIIEQNLKKEEEMKQTLLEREKKEKKDKENKKESSKESKNKSATEKKHTEPAKAEQVVSNIQEEQEDQAAQKELEEMRIADLIKNMSKIKKENCNLICYGLPDVYLSN